jgi:hypothetical protein
MQKKFEELVVGEKFTVNGVEYIKTEDVRISCCRSVNCYSVADSSQKGHFPGNTEVTING